MKDLHAVMVAADYLVDYKLLGPTVVRQKPKTEGSRKQKVTWRPFNQT